MLKISELILPLDAEEEDLLRLAAARLRVKPEAVISLRMIKKSVDARKKQDIHFICTVEAEVCGEEAVLRGCRDPKVATAQRYQYALPPCRGLSRRPVVVGFGPAGMFAALILAQAGQRPIVLERGASVEKRRLQVESFWNGGALDTESNVQFGEGGAGTFSDGKLNTGTKDIRARKVLEELAAAGAPAEILWEAKPHIGTDRLPDTVKNIRRKILSLGGEIRFETKLTGLLVRDSGVSGVRASGPEGKLEIETGTVVLALGHSARDTLESLFESGVAMAPKPFSVGVRIEHPQSLIDRAQYGRFAGHPALGAADYRLAVHLGNGRGVYTFCMCPGGSVVAAASEKGRVVTNGMSSFARDGENANSALLVGVDPSDYGDSHPLSGMYFQRRLEENAFRAGEESYRAPAQKVGDFLRGLPSAGPGEVRPTYRPGVVFGDVGACLPAFVTESLREGLKRMDSLLHGFAFPDAVMTGVETRSSSPVRLLRDETCRAENLRGLYPCGEGAGYAGGIVSAAVDGIRCAESILTAGDDR